MALLFGHWRRLVMDYDLLHLRFTLVSTYQQVYACAIYLISLSHSYAFTVNDLFQIYK